MRIGFSLGNLRERDRLEDLGVDGKVILKYASKNGIRAWTAII